MIRIQLGLRCTKLQRNGSACKRLRVSNRRRCPPCLAHNRASMARAATVLDKRDRCRTCRGPKENPFKSNCDACRAAAVVRARAKRLRSLARGLCRCGRVLAPGYKSCQACVDYCTKRNKRKSQQRAGFRLLKTRGKAWREQGLCERCGQPAPNGTECDLHLAAHAARQRKYERTKAIG